jgi:hypothetical protein
MDLAQLQPQPSWHVTGDWISNAQCTDRSTARHCDLSRMLKIIRRSVLPVANDLVMSIYAETVRPELATFRRYNWKPDWRASA